MLTVKKVLKKIVPASFFSAYHFSLAELGALIYGFPSRKLTVIAVTGTKGKTSTSEYVNAIFEAAGYRTALINSIRIKVGATSSPNTVGRSMPGRFFLQQFLSRAVKTKCTVAILEMTSEGARQHRHRGIALDALVFTNLAPEHIESHGSYEKYADAKFELGKHLVRSTKRPRIMVANADDAQSPRYRALPVEKNIGFALSKTEKSSDSRGGSFVFDGQRIQVNFPGEFSLQNALAAAEVGKAFGIGAEAIAAGIAKLTHIPGRAERVEAGQDFAVVVDYAHTPDSLQALCNAYGDMRRICILGSAGGGRDTWKRPVMGAVAEKNCAHVILTTDDPYDEDPKQIIDAMAAGMKVAPDIVIDRREAIRKGLALARAGDVVLITGKGIDPVYGPGGVKLPWNDADVAREELQKLLSARQV